MLVFTKKFCAFTLAEVLITLGIIGIVASMTLPMLVQNYKEQETVAKVKKFYSVFSQAYTMAVLENGTLDTWGLEDSVLETNDDGITIHTEASLEQANLFIEKIKPYLKSAGYEKLKNQKIDPSMGYMLVDGVRISGMWLATSKCLKNTDRDTYCGDFYIATNSKPYYNKQGKIGKHVFAFYLYRDRIAPVGNNENVFNNCKTGKNYSHCTAWVLLNGNMDYLHCPNELFWNGKTKCSR